MLRRCSSLFVATVAVVSAAACSDSATRLSPSSPTPVAALPITGESGNSTSGLRGSQSEMIDGAAVAAWAASNGWAADELEVEGEGVITAVSGTCPSVTITILGVPVSVTSATTFAGDATCAGLRAGRRVEVRGMLTASGGVISVIATRIAFDADDDDDTDGEGRVLAITGTCPNLTITLEGGLTVTTSSATVFSPAGACELLAVGAKIKVRGTRTGTTIAATSLEIKENGRRRVGGEGTVASLSGTCPTLTMVVHGVRVATNASTRYPVGECGNLRPGTKVRVEGATQPDGSVLAESITILDQPGGRPVAGEGTVASLHGTCPTLTMVVHGYPVMTTSATTFVGGACSAIRPGSRIRVAGTIEGNSVLATMVTLLP